MKKAGIFDKGQSILFCARDFPKSIECHSIRMNPIDFSWKIKSSLNRPGCGLEISFSTPILSQSA